MMQKSLFGCNLDIQTMDRPWLGMCHDGSPKLLLQASTELDMDWIGSGGTTVTPFF